MPPSDRSLESLRRDIDAIDDAMHDLLMRRAAVSDRVRATKGAGVAAFRPGREALILRRLVARHHGALPAAVVVQVWREIIAASVRQQGRFKVAVHAPPGQVESLDVARMHFGALTPLVPLGSVRQVLSALADGQAQVAVVPLPEDLPEEPWWRTLGGTAPRAPHVLARAPFLAGAGPQALLVGAQAFDPSGDDRGYLVVEAKAEVSRARLSGTLAKAGLSPLGIPAETADPGGGVVFLVESETYVAPDDPRLGRFLATNADGVTALRPVGGYAARIAAPARKRT